MPREILMSCSYKLTEAEVVKAMQLHGRGTNKTLVALSIVGVALMPLGIFTDYKAIGFGGAVGGLIGYFAVLHLLIPFNAKRQYKQHRALKNEIRMALSEQGIDFQGESGESKLQWGDIHKWKNGNGVYLLYITSNMFHMVPSRALPNENELSKLWVYAD
jgi:hypothetical protein